jgi:hypothetical protein
MSQNGNDILNVVFASAKPKTDLLEAGSTPSCGDLESVLSSIVTAYNAGHPGSSPVALGESG